VFFVRFIVARKDVINSLFTIADLELNLQKEFGSIVTKFCQDLRSSFVHFSLEGISVNLLVIALAGTKCAFDKLFVLIFETVGSYNDSKDISVGLVDILNVQF